MAAEQAALQERKEEEQPALATQRLQRYLLVEQAAQALQQMETEAAAAAKVHTVLVLPAGMELQVPAAMDLLQQQTQEPAAAAPLVEARQETRAASVDKVVQVT